MVRRAIARRPGALDADDTACRLFHGAADGLSRLTIERYGDAFRVTGGAEKFQYLPVIREALGDPDALFYRFSAEQEGGPSGDAGHRVVQEGELRFAVSLRGARNTGLFLDSRPARAWVLAHSEGLRVLNLFAYTCGFGVAAAAGGARSTTNVDTTAGVLNRGKENYTLNGLVSDGRTFWKSDSAAALKRARKSGAKFELVVLDPPPVRHRNRGRSVDPAAHMGRLALAAFDVLEPDGTLLVLNASHRISTETLVELVGQGAPVWEGTSGADYPPTEAGKALRVMAFKR